MNISSKIYIAGHNGMVGSSIMRNLNRDGFTNLLLRSHSKLDLINQNDVIRFFNKEKPEYVFVAAAKVGGIKFNMLNKTDFLYENLMIQNNVIFSAAKYGVEKLIFIGSSCIYPKETPQPIEESSLLKGPLEETNEGYALAKIAGLKLCKYINEEFNQKFISSYLPSLA